MFGWRRRMWRRRRLGYLWLLLGFGVLLVLFALARGGFAAPLEQDMPYHTENEDHTGMVMGSCADLPVTAEDEAAAAAFGVGVREAAARFVDFDTAVAEGYQQTTPFGRNGRGPAHFLNVGYALDGEYLNAEYPESLIYMPLGEQMVLLGVMFVAPRGEGPCPAGGLIAWHAHDGVCYNDDGLIVAIADDDGDCPTGTVKRDTQEMTHVWTFDNPDGMFATGLTAESVWAAVRQCLQGDPICA